jgi:hypothetical protein
MKISFVILLGLLTTVAEARLLQQGKDKIKNKGENKEVKNKGENKGLKNKGGENKDFKKKENKDFKKKANKGGDGTQSLTAPLEPVAAEAETEVTQQQVDTTIGDAVVAEEQPKPAAKNLGKESKEYGYATAQSLWASTDKGYTCANVAQSFWLDVKSLVFAECETKWAGQSTGGSSNPAGSCRRGAKRFAMDQMDACFTVEDCYRLGVGASATVSRGFCNDSEQGILEREVIPRKCKKLAVITCASDAVKTIEEYFQSSTCATVTDSTLNFVDEIHELCEDEVDDKEASLE